MDKKKERAIVEKHGRIYKPRDNSELPVDLGCCRSRVWAYRQGQCMRIPQYEAGGYEFCGIHIKNVRFYLELAQRKAGGGNNDKP